MGLVIDTSALIELERGAEFESADEVVVIPAIVWAEALVGIRLAKSPARAARRRSQLESIRLRAGIEPFTPEIAEVYADIFAELAASGTPIPQNDIAVAATARSLDFSVLVGPGDETHFRRVPQLSVRVLETPPAN